MDVEEAGLDAASHSNVEGEKMDLERTVNLAEGRGGEVRRGMKSRHIQFLFVTPFRYHTSGSQGMANTDNSLLEQLVALLVPVCSSIPVVSCQLLAQRRCSWDT